MQPSADTETQPSRIKKILSQHPACTLLHGQRYRLRILTDIAANVNRDRDGRAHRRTLRYLNIYLRGACNQTGSLTGERDLRIHSADSSADARHRRREGSSRRPHRSIGDGWVQCAHTRQIHRHNRTSRRRIRGRVHAGVLVENRSLPAAAIIRGKDSRRSNYHGQFNRPKGLPAGLHGHKRRLTRIHFEGNHRIDLAV